MLPGLYSIVSHYNYSCTIVINYLPISFTFVHSQKKFSLHLFTRFPYNWRTWQHYWPESFQVHYPISQMVTWNQQIYPNFLVNLLSHYSADDVNSPTTPSPPCLKLITSLHILYKNSPTSIRNTYLIVHPESPSTYLYLYTHTGLPYSYNRKVTAPILVQPLHLPFKKKKKE